MLVQYGETVVLVATATSDPRPGLDFFPLTCDYRERLAAAGKFPGGFLKREGRPSTKETLSARLMDRPIRPLVACNGFKDEVQVQAFVIASDLQNDGDVLGDEWRRSSPAYQRNAIPRARSPAFGLARLTVSWSLSRHMKSLEASELDMIVSGSRDQVAMIEGFAQEMA